MFGQVVIGPPGSGKTTYCQGMNEFLTSFKRKSAICNLDPANDFIPYQCHIDIRDLINLDEVEQRLSLGPNGALIYCMEYVEQNMQWLLDKLNSLKSDGFQYVLFDFPGQVELYTHNNSVKNILRQLEKNSHRLVSVQLIDSTYCSDPSKFISVVLTSLSSMVHLETPHINVLSKLDLLEKFGRTAFQTDYYTDVLDLKYLVDLLQVNDTLLNSHEGQNKLICYCIF